jgi:hypothetical protein
MTATREGDRHRPTDFAALRRAAQELRSRGLTVQDIATALGLTQGAVRCLLALGHRMETQP